MADGANDRIADLVTEHAIDLQRFDAGKRRDVRAILKDLERELVAKLTREDPAGAVRSATKQARLAKLLEQVRETTRASYRAAGTALANELRELADLEAAFAARVINRGVGFELATVSITRNEAGALAKGVLVQGAPVSDWWSRQAGDTLQRFTDQMRLGIAQGETNAQLVRRIRGGTIDGSPVEGFMAISRRNAESLVRSATQAVAAEARDTTYRQNADILKGITWRATLDTRTTVGCAARDGLLYTLDHEPIDHDLPWDGGPGNRHWGCRSTSAPVVKSWRELGFDRDELPPSTRASMDGQVPRDTSFEAWLSRQPQERQEAVLGPGRAELWRKDGLTFRDLIDGAGRELSLEELRAKVRS